MTVFAEQQAVADESSRLAALCDSARAIASELELEKLMDVVLEHATSLLEAQSGSLYLWDEVAGLLHCARNWKGPAGNDLPDLKAGVGLSGKVLSTGKTLMVANHQNAPDAVTSDVQGRLLAAIGSPLLQGGQTLGVIIVRRDSSAFPFDESDARSLELLAQQAGGAIHRARSDEQTAQSASVRDLDRLKTEWLSTVSHELRTPLTYMVGYSELLSQRASLLGPEQVESMAREILWASTAMSRLVDELLDLASLEHGRLTLVRERVDVAELLESVVAWFRKTPGGHRLALEIPEALDDISADASRLRQIVGNLINNALKFAPEGLVVVRASQKPDELWLEVSDYGPGIAYAEQARVWEKFFRTEAAMAQVTPGVGIGLALVRNLVEHHDGKVMLESRPGAGSTFRVTLPRAL